MQTENLVARTYMIRPDQDDMLRKFCQEQQRSASSAVRYILDAWPRLQRAAIHAADQLTRRISETVGAPAYRLARRYAAGTQPINFQEA
jgi:hypothetical protein